MGIKYRKFFIFYFILTFFLGVNQLYHYLMNKMRFSESFNLFITSNSFNYLPTVVAGIIILLSIVSIILTSKNKLLKFTLIYPIYFIVRMIVLNLLLTLLIAFIVDELDVIFSIMNKISGLYPFLYLFDIGFFGYMIYWLLINKREPSVKRINYSK